MVDFTVTSSNRSSVKISTTETGPGLLIGSTTVTQSICRYFSNTTVGVKMMSVIFDALRQLSGTHYRKLFSAVTLLQFLSLGLIHSSSLRLSLLSLLTNTLPGPSASEVTTLRRYTNLFIIITIIITFLTLGRYIPEGV